MSSDQSEEIGSEEEPMLTDAEEDSVEEEQSEDGSEDDETSNGDGGADESDPENKNNSDEERTNIRSELTTMSFEDLMKLKEKLGAKVYNEAMFGETTKVKSRPKKENVDFKRANKNRPREITSKRPVSFLTTEQGLGKSTATLARDPRFDPKCGTYEPKQFRKDYEFVSDIKTKELKQLGKKLSRCKDSEERTKIKYLMRRLENQLRSNQEQKQKDVNETEEKLVINKKRQEGKTPHFESKRERKTKELVNKFTQLKETGQLDKHLEKRRKKNVARDRKKFSFD